MAYEHKDGTCTLFVNQDAVGKQPTHKVAGKYKGENFEIALWPAIDKEGNVKPGMFKGTVGEPYKKEQKQAVGQSHVPIDMDSEIPF